LLQQGGKQNFVCSPFSVWLSLAALVNATDAANKPALLKSLGAAGFSEKALNESVSETLYNLTDERNRGTGFYHNPLQIANAVFVGKTMTLQKEFQATVADSYRGTTQAVDFGSPKAVKDVNAWASKNTNGLIKEIVQDFDPQTVAANATGKLLLPRFSIDSDCMDLTDALQTLGVPLFDAKAAPLSGLVQGNVPVSLSGAVQKAVITVDERGTTAAAVTVIPATGSGPPIPTKPFSMICDKPFVFILCGDRRQILFTGVVNQL